MPRCESQLGPSWEILSVSASLPGPGVCTQYLDEPEHARGLLWETEQVAAGRVFAQCVATVLCVSLCLK